MKNMPIKQKIHNRIKKDNLITSGSTLIVGLSGGPDSVALLRVLTELKPELDLTIVAAHLDHGWRAESEKEVQFCRELCGQWGVPLVTQKLANFAPQVKFNGSREEFARKTRRLFFENVMKEYRADVIALGHHADDQVETFFIRLIRGTSLAGLTGIRAKQGAYIRPLLDCSKQEILEYLKEYDISYRVDPTNASDEHLRNRIRNKLLPVLSEVDSRASRTFLQAIERLQDTQDFLDEHTKKLWEQIAMQRNGVWQVDAQQLLALHKSMRQQIIMHWLITERVSFVPTQDFFAEIERFLCQPGSKTHQIHTAWGIQKKKNLVHIYS